MDNARAARTAVGGGGGAGGGRGGGRAGRGPRGGGGRGGGWFAGAGGGGPGRAGSWGAALQQSELISDASIISTDKRVGKSGRVNDVDLAESIVFLVKDTGDVQLRRAVKNAVAFDVAGHTVDDVGHRHAGVGEVGVVVDDGGHVDGAVRTEREETLVPVNVTKMK